MIIQIRNNGFEHQARMLEKNLAERIPVEYADGGMSIEFCVNKVIGAEESYLITSEGSGYKITGSDEAGLYYGIGKFLHSSTWTEADFEPKATDGVVTPACSFRAIYFSVHFYNWYHTAPIEELEKYLEELLLYGYNTIICIIPVININNFDDPVFHDSVNKTRAIYKFAKKIGMKVGTIINPSQGLKTTPDELAADSSCYEGRTGGGGKNVCPSKPGAMEYLRTLWVKTFEQYTDIGLDYVLTWPYDEGGCGCEECWPWGANGYLKLVKAVHEDAVSFYPDSKFIVSCWYFDEKFEGPWDELGEFPGLYKRLKEDLSFVDYIMVDSHNDFPHYPLEHEIVKPIVNFPEISMYGVRSWGGRGANPLLKRFQRIWDSSKMVLSGGLPYSEGNYEDISKVQCVGYYWEPDKSYQEILGEYIRYEFDEHVVPEVLEIMELIEESHVNVRSGMEPNMEGAVRAEKLAIEVDTKLGERAKKSWRWRILYIRARIDRMLYEYHVENCQGKEKALYELWQTRESYLADNQEAQDLLQELCKIYHSIDKVQNKNHWTFPPVKGGKVLK